MIKVKVSTDPNADHRVFVCECGAIQQVPIYPTTAMYWCKNCAERIPKFERLLSKRKAMRFAKWKWHRGRPCFI